MRAFTVLLCVVSWATAGGQSLPKADKAFEELEFDQAEKLYQAALEEPGSREERLRALRGLGMSQAIQGEARGAKAAFEKMLLVDPEATVDAGLGPKVSRPFELAKKSVGAKRNKLLVARADSGEVTARLEEDVPLAKELTVHARVKGELAFKPATVRAGQPLTVSFGRDEEVELFAEARDGKNGVLYVTGSEQEPMRFPSLVPPAAVAAAMDDARRASSGEDEVVVEGETTRWPLYVGIGVAVLAAGAAGYVLTQPPPLELPSADRTGNLP